MTSLLRSRSRFGLLLAALGIASTISFLIPRAVGIQAGSASGLGTAQLITPAELARVLQSPKEPKPLILNVGPRMLYAQAHIPGAEYIGAGSEPQGIQQLRARVKSLPRRAFIVLYCGCCPWIHCPNVFPAYKELAGLGFTNVKVLYIADNLGTDWVYKGYPTVRGN
jgi:thiosulfate/3-mercaptopyruvate sulfurtransferase